MHSAATTDENPGQNPGQTLGNRIVSLYASINLATYNLLMLIAEFEDKHYAAHQGFLTTANWLNYQCGIGLTAAREKVRVAQALRTLPAVSQCFSEGGVSYSKVRALTRVATPENEIALLDIARHATAAQAERIFRQYRQTTGGTSSPTETANSFAAHWDEQGNLAFRGRLSAEQGALLLAALQREQDDGADRADALAHLAQRGLSTHASDSSLAAERYQIHVELNGNTQHLRGGPGITDDIVERLSCDASLVTHQCDDHGEPLSVGRKTRTVPPAIRRALVIRDGGCRFPGCTHTRFVDAHHIHHWAKGGATRLSNLVLLCTKHHQALHAGSFRIDVVQPASGAPLFRVYNRQGDYLPSVADDLSGATVSDLFTDDSAESPHPALARSPLAPISPTRRPDYHHINWVLSNFHPPNRRHPPHPPGG